MRRGSADKRYPLDIMIYTTCWLISPPSLFGLPDGNTIVVPGPAVFDAPTFDPRIGSIVRHGTLPVFRAPEEALSIDGLSCGYSISVQDNFVRVTVACADPKEAIERSAVWVEQFCRLLSVKYQIPFDFKPQYIEDSSGYPKKITTLTRGEFFSATTYGIVELRDRVLEVLQLIPLMDNESRRALEYYAFADMQQNFAYSLMPGSVLEAMAHGLAFLQLYKAVTVLIGDPSTDKDHQGKATRLGLPKRYWEERVKPLYKVRCDDDVAHYAHSTPEVSKFSLAFVSAKSVFAEVLEAHLRKLKREQDA